MQDLIGMNVLAALMMTASVNAATLNKCIDARGAVTYSNLPCRDAREARTLEVDPPPLPDPVRTQAVRPAPVKPAADKTPAHPDEPASLRLDTQRSTGKPASHAAARKCEVINDKLGSVLDTMDEARRKGYTQKQMDAWNRDIKSLENKKQQSGCF